MTEENIKSNAIKFYDCTITSRTFEVSTFSFFGVECLEMQRVKWGKSKQKVMVEATRCIWMDTYLVRIKGTNMETFVYLQSLQDQNERRRVNKILP